MSERAPQTQEKERSFWNTVVVIGAVLVGAEILL